MFGYRDGKGRAGDSFRRRGDLGRTDLKGRRDPGVIDRQHLRMARCPREGHPGNPLATGVFCLRGEWGSVADENGRRRRYKVDRGNRRRRWRLRDNLKGRVAAYIT